MRLASCGSADRTVSNSRVLGASAGGMTVHLPARGTVRDLVEHCDLKGTPLHQHLGMDAGELRSYRILPWLEEHHDPPVQTIGAQERGSRDATLRVQTGRVPGGIVDVSLKMKKPWSFRLSRRNLDSWPSKRSRFRDGNLRSHFEQSDREMRRSFLKGIL